MHDLEVEIIRARAHYAANRIIEDGVPFEDSHEDFDELIAQVRKEAKAEALRDFADAHRMPWIIFRDKDGNPVTVSDLMRETAKNYLDKETRNA